MNPHLKPAAFILLAFAYIAAAMPPGAGSTALAQSRFEGRISYRIHEFEPGAGSGMIEKGRIDLSSNSSRISMRSSSSGADGKTGQPAFLIRNDLQDVVLLADKATGFRITRAELNAFSELLGSMSTTSSAFPFQMPGGGPGPVSGSGQGGSSKAPSKLTPQGSGVSAKGSDRWVKSTQTRRMHGLDAVKWTLTDRMEGRETRTDVWLAKDAALDWTFLDMDLSMILGSDQPLSKFSGEILSKGSVPLLMEHHVDGRLMVRITATEVARSRVPAAEFEIPAGMNLRGLNDLLMQMLMGR